MEYTEQSAGSIRLYLTKGDPDLQQFTTLARASCMHSDMSVEFGILGESHFVSFLLGANRLTEVCACTDVKIPSSAECIAYDFLPNLEEDPITTSFATYHYSFTYKYMNWEKGSIRLEELHSKHREDNAQKLTYLFPSPDPDVDPATTKVYVTLDKSIITETVHTYPNEEVMVFTESVLKPI
jgi:hypothetical protein